MFFDIKLKIKSIISGCDRYPNLYREIRRAKAARIMEIGTWKGVHARRMIETAQSSSNSVEYYGFDLFEDMDEKTFDYEYAKQPPSMESVEKMLSETGAKINLYRGDTNKTLRSNVKRLPKMDFIFIDGGHSIDTIKNDWLYSKKLMHKGTVVIFDDYFRNDEEEVKDVGCQHLIDGLDRKRYNVLMLKPECGFKKPWGTLRTSMVKVTMAQHRK